jgi:hypothetical protein
MAIGIKGFKRLKTLRTLRIPCPFAVNIFNDKVKIVNLTNIYQNYATTICNKIATFVP